MDLIGFFVLFTLATSLAAIYELWWPVMQLLEKEQPDHNMVEYKGISYFVFFLLGCVFAVVLLPICLVPSMGASFRLTCLDAIKTD